MSAPGNSRARFLELLRTAVAEKRCEKIVLSKPNGTDPTLKKLLARPVILRAGPMLSFVWTYQTRDITKNIPPDEGVQEIGRLLGTNFLDAHLFTTDLAAQFTISPGGERLHVESRTSVAPAAPAHDRGKHHLIPAQSTWLRALGVTNDAGRPREGMAAKYRQIQKFAEILHELLAQTFENCAGVRVVDMGSGKGYLTFAVAELLGARGSVVGVEAREELVESGNRVAAACGLASQLQFSTGNISDHPAGAVDVLIALHACDTATDDALAHGVASGAKVLVVSPCCQKELRPQLQAPPVLASALRHGIFLERHAEFVTDALRAGLLEWAGYRTKVFEFVATEHTAKNLLITAVKERPAGAVDDERAQPVRALAQFYGIRTHALARHLQFPL